jgi:hypothetical protein
MTHNHLKGVIYFKRPIIPDDKVDWSVKWDDYKHLVLAYTSPIVLQNPVWADPKLPRYTSSFNIFKLPTQNKISLILKSNKKLECSRWHC